MLLWQFHGCSNYFSLTGFSPYIKRPRDGLSPIISSEAHAEVKIPIGVEEVYIRLGSTATFRCDVTGMIFLFQHLLITPKKKKKKLLVTRKTCD